MFLFIVFFTAPFTGVLVRYRLAYHSEEARAVAADLEAATPQIASDTADELAAVPTRDMKTCNMASNSTDASGQVGESSGTKLPRETVATPPTFFGIAKRIYQIEGKSGFYKGIIPTIITDVFMQISARNILTRFYISPAPSTFNRTLTQTLIGTLFYIFALVWIYRSIATRTKLEVFGTSIKDAIHALFTHFERARPYRILTLNLLCVLLGQILLQKFVFYPLRRMVEPDQITINGNIDVILLLRLGAFLMLVLVNTLICAPLDVIVTRLAVQRNFGTSHITTEEPLDTDTPVPRVKTDEKHMSLTGEPEMNENLAVKYRDDDLEPYTSVYDCAMKIIKEEGWTVLYRGWFITFLGKIYS